MFFRKNPESFVEIPLPTIPSNVFVGKGKRAKLLFVLTMSCRTFRDRLKCNPPLSHHDVGAIYSPESPTGFVSLLGIRRNTSCVCLLPSWQTRRPRTTAPMICAPMHISVGAMPTGRRRWLAVSAPARFITCAKAIISVPGRYQSTPRSTTAPIASITNFAKRRAALQVAAIRHRHRAALQVAALQHHRVRHHRSFHLLPLLLTLVRRKFLPKICIISANWIRTSSAPPSGIDTLFFHLLSFSSASFFVWTGLSLSEFRRRILS